MIQMLPGVVDNSGLRLVLTTNLRQYDAGTLEVGRKVIPGRGIMIPPNAEHFVLSGECGSDCVGQVGKHFVVVGERFFAVQRNSFE